MRKLFLLAFLLVCLFLSKLSAQVPHISYQKPVPFETGKTITPIKVTNTGGAVVNTLYPQANSIVKSTAPVHDFVRTPSGDIYGILSPASSITHIKPDGTYSLFVGGPYYGYADGSGSAAMFGEIGGIAQDAAGNLYVTEINGRDGLNSRVRKITSAGVVSTYASGFQGPQGIAVDANGIVYISESAGRIMKIDKNGVVSLLAGKIGQGKNDGTGANASFNDPEGLAADKSGNIYVADFGNNMIRKITPQGVVTTIAGSGQSGSDDGTGAAATFYNPESVHLDSKGNIFITDRAGILRKINPANEVFTIDGPYYDQQGQAIVEGNFSGSVVIDENDNIIEYAGSPFFGIGFYKVLTQGYNISPALPAGLVFSADGTISGTPTALAAKAAYKITASNPSGMSSATIDIEVGVPTDPPVIDSFNPVAAYARASMDIKGKNFLGATSVVIGGKAAYYQIISPTAIFAYVASDATSGEVSVTNPYGTGHLSGFSIIPPPTISSISPTSGWKGSSITITGTGFTGATQVLLGGYNASFKVLSATQIEATVGAGASGNVNVNTPSGSVSFPGFSFINAPAISSVSPASAGAGTTVTITGTDFSNTTSVQFGTMAASSFTVVSPTKITAVVASGSSNGVTVSTPAGTSNYQNFSFILPPLITQASPMKGGYNSNILIYGSNLSGAQVSIGGPPASIIYNNSGQLSVTVGSGASSGDFTVVTPGGKATLPGFIWVPAPHITSFTPQTAGLGDKVTITGTDLTEVDNVSFGGVGATFTVLSSTTIEATVGNGASGLVSVVSEGGSASLQGFIHKGPAITSFLPAHAGKGETVIINGVNFTSATSVDFGGVSAVSFTVNSPTQISAVVGSGKSGSVSVVTPLGKSSLAGFDHPGPVITGVNPADAGPLSNTPTIITGSNFTGASAVSIGGVAATSFTVISSTSISVTPPVGASGDVAVTTPLGTDKKAGFVWVQPPSITSIAPASQKNTGTVVITGTNFTGVTGVKFGGVPALAYSVLSSTTINAIVGNGASGDITVSTVGGSALIHNFTYTSPSITSISPAVAAKNQTVTITGANLSKVQSVKFGGVDAASFTIASAEKITAVIGSGASGDVSVNSPDGVASITGFTFAGSPTISSLTPAVGGAGTIMTINGSNLKSTLEVQIGNVPATIITVTDNQVVVKVGSGATGKVMLKNIAGTTEFDGFTWYGVPTITSASPMTANSATTVTITGTNFTGATQVSFGQWPTNFTVVSPTQITAQPSIFGESGDIVIKTPGGVATLPGFTFLPKPVISSFTVDGEGTDATVTITGKNFVDVKDVSFGGVSAKSFNVISSSSITANPGAGATGMIDVRTTGGIDSIPGFLFSNPPVVLSFAPAFGPIGTTVAIEGDNFNTSAQKNIVFFGPVKAQVKSASKTHLEVTVPAGATDLITVANLDKRLSASSNLPFLVTNTSRTATFSNKLDLKFKTGLGRYAISDFDGDGNPDLLIPKDDSIYILKHGSDPMMSKSSFLQKVVLQIGRQSTSMVVGDLDGDGKMDILYSNTSIILLHNTSTEGNISFEQKTLENLNGTTGSMTLRDMNLDGRPDLVLYDAYSLSFYPNTTTGSTISFGPLTWLQNTSSSGTISSALTDIDGDNRPDPIGGSSYTGISIFKNNSVPGNLSSSDFSLTYFSHPGNYYMAWGITTGDFDGDGKVDIVEDDFSNHVLLVSRNLAKKGIIDASSLDQAKAFSNSSLAFNPITADVDGDGKVDLVSSNTGVYYARNQSTPGNISFGGAAPLIADNPNGSAAAIRLNDMDGDGRADLILISNSATGTMLSIYHNGPIVVPKITDVSPLTATTGDEVTISGQHFDGTTSVNFGNKAAKSFTIVSSEKIVAVVGDGETGDVTIQTPNGPASFSGFKFYVPPPVNNFKVAATSVTCKGENNGSISITAVQPADYTTVLTGNGLNKDYQFTTTQTIDALAPGTYNVCITNATLADYKQCFDLVITEPKDLSVYADVNKNTNTVNLNLDGGSSYQISLNSVNYETSNNSITLPLSKGSNTLTVITDKLCQGRFEQTINVSGDIIPYPNPFQNVLYLNIGEQVVKKATVKIFSVNTGLLQLVKEFNNQSGVISTDVSNLGTGVYSLHLITDTKELVYKIIKK